MNEEVLKKMKFGEIVSDAYGNRYTRTIGGWIFSNFSGNLCFIPETAGVVKNEPAESGKTRKPKTEK